MTGTNTAAIPTADGDRPGPGGAGPGAELADRGPRSNDAPEEQHGEQSGQAARQATNAALRAWRESAGMTRPQMAEALTLTASALEKQLLPDAKLIIGWETGATRWPSLKYRRALHELTGRDAAALGFVPPGSGKGTPGPAQPPRPGTDQARGAR